MYCTCTVHVADGTYVRYSFYFSNRSTYMYVLCFEMIIDSLNNLRKVRSFMYIKVPTVLHHGIPIYSVHEHNNIQDIDRHMHRYATVCSAHVHVHVHVYGTCKIQVNKNNNFQ